MEFSKKICCFLPWVFVHRYAFNDVNESGRRGYRLLLYICVGYRSLSELSRILCMWNIFDFLLRRLVMSEKRFPPLVGVKVTVEIPDGLPELMYDVTREVRTRIIYIYRISTVKLFFLRINNIETLWKLDVPTDRLKKDHFSKLKNNNVLRAFCWICRFPFCYVISFRCCAISPRMSNRHTRSWPTTWNVCWRREMKKVLDIIVYYLSGIKIGLDTENEKSSTVPDDPWYLI